MIANVVLPRMNRETFLSHFRLILSRSAWDFKFFPAVSRIISRSVHVFRRRRGLFSIADCEIGRILV